MAIQNIHQITTIIIHCAATPNGKDFCAAEINGWHKERGFRRDPALVSNSYPLDHMGYHYAIKLDGTIEAGRTLVEVGAHAKSHNRNSIGICLIGTDKFTEAQWLQLGGLIQQLRSEIPNIEHVIGHNEVANKVCPGFDVQEWLSGSLDQEKHTFGTSDTGCALPGK